MRLRMTALIGLSIACWISTAAATPTTAPANAADKLGVKRGIVAVVGDADASAAMALAANADLTVYIQLKDAAAVEAMRRTADAAGTLNRRVFIEHGDASRIHLADNVADAVLALGAVPKEELLRVLVPGGKAVAGDQTVTKPFPAGIDDWSHHYHGPDNNPQSRDTLAKAPYLTQFVADPRYAPAPQAAVASAGRLFMAFGNVAWHEREEPMLNTLLAVNGYNGTVLWKKALPEGLLVDRSTMIATPETLYLADNESCKLLDAATGEVKDQIAIPAGTGGGTAWHWMALSDGVLYALVGKADPPDPVARWKRTAHGWPWNNISEGYTRKEFVWGMGDTLVAIDPKTKKVLWKRSQDPSIDSRGICLSSGRVFICSFGNYLACLDAKTGKDLWRRTPEKDADLFKAIGPYRAGQGPVSGWKSAAYLKCTDKALFFVGPQVDHVTAVSADKGELAWTFPHKDMQIVIRGDEIVTIAPAGSKEPCSRLDAATGKVLDTVAVTRRTRATGGPDGVFFRAADGTVRLDAAANRPQWITTMRPSCHVGVVISGGQLYWLPWSCDCNLQMFGLISCASAGAFEFNQAATDADRLEVFTDACQPFPVQKEDWVCYRADNMRTAWMGMTVPLQVQQLWEYRPKVAFEPSAPVFAGGRVFIGGSDGVVRALDGDTGQERWKAYTGGAVRFPPALDDGRAFVGSADGFAYAFEAASGKPLWRFLAAPAQRNIPVYGTLTSTWPVNSGVLVEKGVAYFAAGINSFDGTHVYALDAATGKIKWQNNTSGHLDEFSRRGVAAQGEMLLYKDTLYLAGGNAASPGAYAIADGKCLSNVPTAPGSSAPRGRELTRKNDKILVSGQPLYSVPAAPVYDNPTRWEPVVITPNNALVTLVPSGGKDKAVTWKLVAQDPAGVNVFWEQTLPAEPVRWGIAIDAQGRIVVALRDGRVICFGQPPKRT